MSSASKSIAILEFVDFPGTHGSVRRSGVYRASHRTLDANLHALVSRSPVERVMRWSSALAAGIRRF
jgi:hypothetical protein